MADCNNSGHIVIVMEVPNMLENKPSCTLTRTTLYTSGQFVGIYKEKQL